MNGFITPFAMLVCAWVVLSIILLVRHALASLWDRLRAKQ